MTTKDLRDIASYYSLTITVTVDDDSRPRFLFGCLAGILNEMYDSVKLHLRPIASLTDEEVFKCCNLMDYGISASGKDPVVRSGNGYYVANYISLAYDGSVDIDNDPDRHTTTIKTDWIAMYHAYLQSIGVHVPGTIDPKYVTLIS